MSITGSYHKHLYPQTTSTYNLGSASLIWNNGYFDTLTVGGIANPFYWSRTGTTLSPKTAGDDIKFNASSIFDSGNTRLGIGTLTPESVLDVRGTITEVLMSLGTDITDGLILKNTTPATTSLGQNSPANTMYCQAWSTSENASKEVSFVQYAEPIRTGNPAAKYRLSSIDANGTFFNVMEASIYGVAYNVVTYFNENVVFPSNRNVFIGSGLGDGFIWSTPQTADSLLLFLNDTTKTLLITTASNKAKNHDHTTQANPTIFGHSATNPDTDNTQWWSITHDQTNAVFGLGKGGYSFPNGRMIRSKSVYTGTDTTDEVSIHVCDSATAFTLTVTDGSTDGEEIKIVNRGAGTVTLSGKFNSVTTVTTLYSGESMVFNWDVADDNWE